MSKGIILVSLLVALRKYSDKTNIRKEKVTLLIVKVPVYLGFLLLCRDTMTTVALIRKAFNRGWLTVRGSIHYHHGGVQPDWCWS